MKSKIYYFSRTQNLFSCFSSTFIHHASRGIENSNPRVRAWLRFLILVNVIFLFFLVSHEPVFPDTAPTSSFIFYKMLGWYLHCYLLSFFTMLAAGVNIWAKIPYFFPRFRIFSFFFHSIGQNIYSWSDDKDTVAKDFANSMCGQNSM